LIHGQACLTEDILFAREVRYQMAEEEKGESYSIAGFKVQIKDFSRGCTHCGRFGMVKDKDFGADRCIHCGTLQIAK
jgi:hypothetical protein